MRIIQHHTTFLARSVPIHSQAEVIFSHQANRRLHREENGKLVRENGRLKTSGSITEELKKLRTETVTLQGERTSLISELGRVENEVFGLKIEVEELEKENVALVEEVEVTKDKLTLSIQDCEEMKMKWEELQLGKVELGRKLSESTDSRDTLLADIEKLKIANETIGSDLTATRKELSTTNSKAAEQQEAYTSLKAQFCTTTSDLVKTKSSLASTQQALQESKAANTRLEDEIARLRSAHHVANVLAAIVDSRFQAARKQLAMVEAENKGMHKECVRLKGVLGGLCDFLDGKPEIL